MNEVANGEWGEGVRVGDCEEVEVWLRNEMVLELRVEVGGEERDQYKVNHPTRYEPLISIQPNRHAQRAIVSI